MRFTADSDHMAAILPRQRGNVDAPVEDEAPPPEDGANNGILPGGAIAGIVVGVLVFVCLIVVGSWWLTKTRRRKARADIETQKQMSLDARSSVGTRPSNVTAPNNDHRLDRTMPAEDHAGVTDRNVGNDTIQQSPDVTTNNGPGRI